MKKGYYSLKTSVPLAYASVSPSDRNSSVVLLPLRSQRLVVVPGNHILSEASQRQLRQETDSECNKAFNRVEQLINTKLLKTGLSRLRNNETCAYQVHFRQKIRELTTHDENIPSDDWFKRRACQTFALYLHFFAEKQLRRTIRHWRNLIKHERAILWHFFDRWNVKTSLLKLNRMNARRFLYLTRGVGRKIEKHLLTDAIKRWTWHTQWTRHLVRVRLLFRCWKTVVTAISKRKKRLRMLGLTAFKLHHEHAQMMIEDLTTAVYRVKARNLELKALFAWRVVWSRLRVLHRILRLHRPLFAAFYSWKSLILLPYPQYSNSAYSPRTSRNSSPRRSQDLSAGRRVVAYQSATGAVVTRQIVKHRRPPTTPASANARKLASKPTNSAKRVNLPISPKDVKKLSPLDKLMIRLNNVKEFEESFEEVERVRRLQHSIDRKQFAMKTPARSTTGGHLNDISFSSQRSKMSSSVNNNRSIYSRNSSFI